MSVQLLNVSIIINIKWGDKNEKNNKIYINYNALLEYFFLLLRM